MKSEEFIMQELEKEKNQKAAESDAQGGDADKPNIKFMISGEAPVLMSKACELLIKDLSFRAWRHTERNRRRTLQRQDLHAAVGESEVYDFLIDIVPRVTTQKSAVHQPDAAATMTTTIPAGLSLGGLPPGLPTVPPPSMTSPPAMPSMACSFLVCATFRHLSHYWMSNDVRMYLSDRQARNDSPGSIAPIARKDSDHMSSKPSSISCPATCIDAMSNFHSLAHEDDCGSMCGLISATGQGCHK